MAQPLLPARFAVQQACVSAVTMIAGLQFGADDGGYQSSGGGENSPLSSNYGTSESEGSSSSNADEFCHELREFRRRASDRSPSASFVRDEVARGSPRQVSESSACVLDDIDKHQRRMLLLLPAFSTSASSGARTDALSRWLTGFDVGWVLDMGAGESLPRREVGRRVRAWTQALSPMERVFRLRHRELMEAQVAALGELAAASSSAMLKLAGSVAALGSSPSKLLAALDVYVPVSEAFPVLKRMFSWSPPHPVSAAAETMLAHLVDAARRAARDLRAFIRSHYPWRMPQVGEVHPCVGFWMGYFRCMLRNRFTLYFVLGDEDGEGEGRLSMVAELISCLEAVLEEKSAALAFPGLRPVFMLNNTFAIVRRAMRYDFKLFLPPEWVCGGVLGARRVAPRRRQRRETDHRSPAPEQPAEHVLLIAGERVQRAERLESAQPGAPGILRKTVSENVVPVYRRYLEDHPEVEVANERTAEELKQQLSDLFEG